MDLIDQQASLHDQWASISNFEDNDWDVRASNGNAYWFPENGNSNSVAWNGSNRWNIHPMTPADIQGSLTFSGFLERGKYTAPDGAQF